MLHFMGILSLFEFLQNKLIYCRFEIIEYQIRNALGISFIEILDLTINKKMA